MQNMQKKAQFLSVNKIAFFFMLGWCVAGEVREKEIRKAKMVVSNKL